MSSANWDILSSRSAVAQQFQHFGLILLSAAFLQILHQRSSVGGALQGIKGCLHGSNPDSTAIPEVPPADSTSLSVDGVFSGVKSGRKVPHGKATQIIESPSPNASNPPPYSSPVMPLCRRNLPATVSTAGKDGRHGNQGNH